MKPSEYTAHAALDALAAERMRWVAVLGDTPNRKRINPRRTLWELVFGF